MAARLRLPLLLLAACDGPAPVAPPQSRPIDDAAGAPTWHQTVAPIVARSCGGCHVEGGLTFSLADYAAAAPMAGAIAAATEARRMPPWLAQDTESCTPPLPWKDDLRLSDAEIATLAAWAAAGAPEGDPDRAAPIEVAEPISLEGVTHEVEPLAPFVTEGDSDEFICFVLDPGLDRDHWLTGLEVAPGNARVVHHALVFADYSGESLDKADAQGAYPCFGGPGIGDFSLVAAWAPGARPMTLPEDAGMPLPAGTTLVMQVHYHPGGEAAAPDSTALRLQLTDEAPAHDAGLYLIGNARSARQGLLPGPNDTDGQVEFRIPAGVADHSEAMELRIPRATAPFKVWLAGTHAHYLGTDLRFSVRDGDTDEETCLVQTPRWDFNWQGGYVYDAPYAELPELSGGDVLVMRCGYDNTLDNPGLAAALADAGLDAPVDVYLGEETLDEMCLGVMGVID